MWHTGSCKETFHVHLFIPSARKFLEETRGGMNFIAQLKLLSPPGGKRQAGFVFLEVFVGMVEDALKVAIYRIVEARQELDAHGSVAWASAHHTLDKALAAIDGTGLFPGYKDVPKAVMKEAEARLFDAAAADRTALAQALGLVDIKPTEECLR